MMIRVQNLDGSVGDNITGGDLSGSLHFDLHHLGVAGIGFQQHLLQVEDHIGNVLDHSIQGAEFVGSPFQFNGGDRAPFQRREKNPAKGIANGASITGLKRLGIVTTKIFRTFRIIFHDAFRHFKTT